MERRLAAIVATDIVGYTRLVEADEELTIARQHSHRQELIDPRIARHHGRIVKSTGDGLLIEFSSVVNAVRCAVDMQRAVAEREAEQPEGQRIRYRIGINLGDIVIEQDDILGDGVNIAARLQEIADHGGIALSNAAYDQATSKIDAAFEDAGEHQLKNIARPIRVWRWVGDASPLTKGVVDVAKRLPLPSKPSIAIMPFANMSSAPEQSCFAEGITQDIVTALSKIAELFVIFADTRTSHGKAAPEATELAAGLGVSHFLKGSVQTAGNRVRVSAQLVEAKTGRNLWAERYDRELTDIFRLQDTITQEIVTALQVNLTEGEQARLRRRQTESIAAWECYVRGISNHRRFTRDGTAAARALFEQALALDPNFGAALAYLARSHWQEARAGWSESPQASLERAADCVARSLEIDDGDAEANTSLGMVRLLQRRFDEAIAAGERAIDLGPNVAESYVMLALTLIYAGNSEKGVALINKAMRLSPFYHDNLLGVLANGYRMLGRYEESIALERERLNRNADNFY
ncbi:MAG: adenylate/guanylate cyclase domain-containing protein, partial [Geminicoccaceae bacterium]